MTIKTETNLRNFKTWSGATDTKKIILDAGLEEEFEILIDELYPNGLSDTELNDILWFDSDWILENLEIKEEEEEE